MTGKFWIFKIPEAVIPLMRAAVALGSTVRVKTKFVGESLGSV
jgi:hypothetical protein